MASKAHVIHDYSFGGAYARPRRQVWKRRDTDPVVVPRTSMWRTGGGAIATAIAMGALVVGSAYAAYRPTTPQLAETPALPLSDAWQPDTTFVGARVTNALLGPARAVPDKVAPLGEAEAEDAVPWYAPASQSDSSSFESAAPESRPESREVIIDDSKMYPAPKTEPYPNPTTTPPDAVAPAPATPLAPAPSLDPENPYRD